MRLDLPEALGPMRTLRGSSGSSGVSGPKERMFWRRMELEEALAFHQLLQLDSERRQRGRRDGTGVSDCTPRRRGGILSCRCVCVVRLPVRWLCSSQAPVWALLILCGVAKVSRSKATSRNHFDLGWRARGNGESVATVLVMNQMGWASG